jgi:nitrogen fixation protein FixH
VIADVEQQAALGWTLDARAAADGRAFVALADHSGAPLTGAHLEAVAERPLGSAHSIALAFREQAPGRYVADLPLGLPGQWDLSLTANAGGHEVVTTRRVVVR